jgi:CelD/BcsL family acetyltransferase involved in cellulose biosynthesis
MRRQRHDATLAPWVAAPHAQLSWGVVGAPTLHQRGDVGQVPQVREQSRFVTALGIVHQALKSVVRAADPNFNSGIQHLAQLAQGSECIPGVLCP